MNTECNSGVYEMVNTETRFYPTPYNAANFIATAIYQQQQMLHHFLRGILNPHATPFAHNSNSKTYNNKPTSTYQDTCNIEKDMNTPSSRNINDTNTLLLTTSTDMNEDANGARESEWKIPLQTKKINHKQFQQTELSSNSSNCYSILEEDSFSAINDSVQSNSITSNEPDTQQNETTKNINCISISKDKIIGQTIPAIEHQKSLQQRPSSFEYENALTEINIVSTKCANKDCNKKQNLMQKIECDNKSSLEVAKDSKKFFTRIRLPKDRMYYIKLPIH